MNELVEVGDNSPTINSMSLVDVESAKAFMDNYQDVCKALLDKSDYQKIGANKFKKKSAWRKIATAFNISDDIVEKEIIRDENHQIISARYEVLATAPNGRHGIGTASCSIFDKVKNSDEEMPSNFELRKRFNNAENDVIGTAHTRAKSRAISDLVGMGEVSAEEIGEETSTKKSVSIKPKAAPKTKAKEPKKEKPNKGIDEAIEVEVVESKPRKTIKDLMDENKHIKKAVDELQDENRTVNRDAIKDRLISHVQSGVLSEKDYADAKQLME